MFGTGHRAFASRAFSRISNRRLSYSKVTMSTPPKFSGPIHWILDWDGTITKRDTLDALVNIAAQCKPDSPVNKNWKCVSQAYLTDYEKTLQIYASDGKLPTTIEEESSLLANLEEVELRSINRVSASGIFEGLTTDDVDNGAAKAIESGAVELRKGCNDFLRLIEARAHIDVDRGESLSILSVNWSKRFILGCLKATHEDFKMMVDSVICANELDGIEPGVPTTGRICANVPRIISSGNKLTQLQLLRDEVNKVRPEKALPVVYIGDSWTDVECLLAADLGICIRDDIITSTQKRLADSLKRLGVPCPRLQDTDKSDGVVWVESFHEIERWLRKRHCLKCRAAFG
jgi:hypothetical protein